MRDAIRIHQAVLYSLPVLIAPHARALARALVWSALASLVSASHLISGCPNTLHQWSLRREEGEGSAGMRRVGLKGLPSGEGGGGGQRELALWFPFQGDYAGDLNGKTRTIASVKSGMRGAAGVRGGDTSG